MVEYLAQGYGSLFASPAGLSAGTGFPQLIRQTHKSDISGPRFTILRMLDYHCGVTMVNHQQYKPEPKQEFTQAALIEKKIEDYQPQALAIRKQKQTRIQPARPATVGKQTFHRGSAFLNLEASPV